MAVTLTEAAKLTQDMLYKGVVEEMLKATPLLQHYPFVEINGNALTVTREDVDNMGNTGFVATGGVLTSSEAKFTQKSFTLYNLYGQADVPGLIQRSQSNIMDQMAAQVSIKSKLLGYDFEDRAYYGVAATDEGFDGLHTLVALSSSQMVHMGTGGVGAPLTIAMLDELYDLVEGGAPDIIVMNKKIRRRLSEKLRDSASYMTERDAYGNYFNVWNEVPIIATDHLLQTEDISGTTYSTPTGGLTSSIFAIRFGEGDGLCGIQNGGIRTEVFDKLEQYDAARTRLMWYVGQALYGTKALARLDGVTNAAMA